MAVYTNNGKRSSAIAFTLPISCQICLGKVKHPVLCPNNHAFCSSCMEVWLERNQQCPACRTPINEENPCKEIRGGVSVVEEEGQGSMNTAELRRARFEMLFKDYESELTLTQAKLQALKVENKALQQQLDIKKSSQNLVGPQKVNEPDIDALAAITKKLQDATKQYEKVKQEVIRYKKENEGLKEDNDLLMRENQRLRMEITSRSPHRYGRTTVAALQSQIESYEKEVNQLNRALQKSDKYIEDLEQELTVFRGNFDDGKKVPENGTKILCEETLTKDSAKSTHKKRLFVDETDGKESQLTLNTCSSDPSTSCVSLQKANNVNSILVNPQRKDVSKVTDSPSPSKSPKKVTFVLPENTLSGTQMSSFDLEMPSPFSQTSTDTSELPSTDITPTKKCLGTNSKELKPSGLQAEKSKDEIIPKPNKLESSGSFVSNEKAGTSKSMPKGLNDSLDIESELGDLDISVTPELKDCMKLFNMAERKVQERSSLGGSSTLSLDSPLELPSPVDNGVVKQSDQSSQDYCISNDERHRPTTTNVKGFAVKQSNDDTGQTIKPVMTGHSQSIFTLAKSDKMFSAPTDKREHFSQGSSLSAPVNLSESLLHPPSIKGQTSGPPNWLNRSEVSRSVAGMSSLSGSVVSNVLGLQAKPALPPPIASSRYVDSNTLLLSQSLLNHPTSEVRLPKGSEPLKVTLPSGTSQPILQSSSSLLNNSLMLNNKNTESLASSLMKLEQTLAAHRATNLQMPRLSDQPTSSNTALPKTGLLSNVSSAPPTFPMLPLTTHTSQAMVNSGLHSTSGSGPCFQQGVNGPNPQLGFSGYGPSHVVPISFPSATSLSNSILFGSSNSPAKTYSSAGINSVARWAESSSGANLTSDYPSALMPPSMSADKINNYSYVSSSTLNDISSSLDGSFLPEPKKRLFETDTDDTDLALSPMKSSKLR